MVNETYQRINESTYQRINVSTYQPFGFAQGGPFQPFTPFNPIEMQQFGFPYQVSLKSQLTGTAQELLSAAESAAEKAYAPYSKFKVGAALLLTDGSIITGANHENAAYPAGICAEHAVLGNHDMNGTAKVQAIAIAYKADNTAQHPPLSPCGLCRQSLLETQLNQNSPITVYMSSPDGNVIMVEDASYLLPFHFSSEYL